MTLSNPSLETILSTFLSAFTTLSVPSHIALCSPKCTHVFAPSSLNIAPKSNDAFAAHITNISPLLDRFPVTAKETHINEAGRQITIWATGKPQFKKEDMGDSPAEEWEYVGEYIFILDIDGDNKIARIVEVLDSLATERLRGLMVKARQNLGQAGHAW